MFLFFFQENRLLAKEKKKQVIKLGMEADIFRILICKFSLASLEHFSACAFCHIIAKI